MLPVSELRHDFPLLQQKVNNRPIVYFDNACMSLRPQPVIEAINRYYTDYSACAGRSNHRLAQAVSDEIETTRETVKNFIKVKKREEIILTRNTTEGLNLVANSLKFNPGDVVLTSDKEHNSNLVPWQKLSQTKGIVHKIIPSNEDNSFNLEKYSTRRTKTKKARLEIISDRALFNTLYCIQLEVNQLHVKYHIGIGRDGAAS